MHARYPGYMPAKHAKIKNNPSPWLTDDMQTLTVLGNPQLIRFATLLN